LTAGNVEVSKKHQHIGIKHISCLDKQNVWINFYNTEHP
jgi:hypothetical protein